MNEDDLLGWLAGLEIASEHVLAKAVIREALKRGLDVGTVANVKIKPGLGIQGTVKRQGQSRVVTAGTESFTASKTTSPDDEALTVIHVAWDGKVRGRVYLADTIRPDAADAVARLHEERIKRFCSREIARTSLISSRGKPGYNGPRRRGGRKRKSKPFVIPAA